MLSHPAAENPPLQPAIVSPHPLLTEDNLLIRDSRFKKKRNSICVTTKRMKALTSLILMCFVYCFVFELKLKLKAHFFPNVYEKITFCLFIIFLKAESHTLSQAH